MSCIYIMYDIHNIYYSLFIIHSLILQLSHSCNCWLHSSYDTISRTLESRWLPISPSSVSKCLALFTLCSVCFGFLITLGLVHDVPFDGHLLHVSSLLDLLNLSSWQDSYPPVCCFLYQLLSAPAVRLLLMSEPHWMVTG